MTKKRGYHYCNGNNQCDMKCGDCANTGHCYNRGYQDEAKIVNALGRLSGR